MKISDNIKYGWRTTFSGVIFIGLSVAYFWQYEAHLIYCVGGVLLGGGFIVAPDELKPLFVRLLKGLIRFVVEFVSSKFKKS